MEIFFGEMDKDIDIRGVLVHPVYHRFKCKRKN